jgi:hypothetical protein
VLAAAAAAAVTADIAANAAGEAFLNALEDGEQGGGGPGSVGSATTTAPGELRQRVSCCLVACHIRNSMPWTRCRRCILFICSIVMPNSTTLFDTAAAAAAGDFGILGGVQTEWGELVHTYCAPSAHGPDAGGAHPSFGELALLYGERCVVCDERQQCMLHDRSEGRW